MEEATADNTVSVYQKVTQSQKNIPRFLACAQTFENSAPRALAKPSGNFSAPAIRTSVLLSFSWKKCFIHLVHLVSKGTIAAYFQRSSGKGCCVFSKRIPLGSKTLRIIEGLKWRLAIHHRRQQHRVRWELDTDTDLCNKYDVLATISTKGWREDEAFNYTFTWFVQALLGLQLAA